MNLIPSNVASLYAQKIDDIHDSFAQEIQVIKDTKVPNNQPITDADDDYNVIYDTNVNNQNEYTFGIISTTIKARVKYLDKQEIDLAFALSRTDEINLTQKFGLIRLKVHLSDCELVSDSSRVIVDGFNTRVLFRDQRHGIIDFNYCTFYVQRTD